MAISVPIVLGQIITFVTVLCKRHLVTKYDDIYTEIQNRSEQEKLERDNAIRAAKDVLKSTGRFELKNPTVNWGSRMQKCWMIVKPTAVVDQSPLPVLTIAPISRHCPLLETDEETGGKTLKKETVKTLNELIGVLQQHPYIHPLTSMTNSQPPVMVYYHTFGLKQVIMVQANTRSLKDVIHKVKFTENGKDWSEKYPTSKPKKTHSYCYTLILLVTGVLVFECCVSIARRGVTIAFGALRIFVQRVSREVAIRANKIVPLSRFRIPLISSLVVFSVLAITSIPNLFRKKPPAIPLDEMPLYGRQILEAMVFLYKQGFPVLGHVHSGNIFVQDGMCRLGGYENTLLGYRSRYYRMCQDHLEHMDVIMFGHLVFEMCCGYELTTVTPTPQDYQAVRDLEGGEMVEEVLQYIFADGFPHGIKDILKLEFFQSVNLEHLDQFNGNQIHLSSEMTLLIAKAGGADPQNQGPSPAVDVFASKKKKFTKCGVS